MSSGKTYDVTWERGELAKGVPPLLNIGSLSSSASSNSRWKRDKARVGWHTGDDRECAIRATIDATMLSGKGG